MKLLIESKEENKLHDKIVVGFLIEHEGLPTPPRIQVREELAKSLKKDKELIVVQTIRTSYGRSKSVGKAHVYSNKETMMKNEPKYLLLRNQIIKKEEKKEGEN